jgi:tungstate transport system substrate-binding protein
LDASRAEPHEQPTGTTVPVTATYGQGPNRFSLATASPGELGLLRALGQAFCTKAGCALDWIKAGSGRSLDLLRLGRVDMIMVHAPAAVARAVAEGWAGGKTCIGSNAFLLVGPAADPAGIARATSAADAYQRIAAARATFFSRGDDSGTHRREMAIWRQAGLAPSGAWYVATGEFMTATLERAHAAGGYFMTDSSTWVAEKKRLPHLTELFSDDPTLVNTYHALYRLEKGRPASALAAAFLAFTAGEPGQAIIGSFGTDLHGRPLYADAAASRPYDVP